MPAVTPTEADLLLAAVRSQLARVHTSLPGVVVSYDEATQTATVRPSVRFKFKDADGVIQAYDPPAIANVPVAFPRSGAFSITWPIAAGDTVTLWFSERSLDEWKSVAGSTHEARDVRRFDLSDAVAYPGGYSPADALASSAYAAAALVIKAAEIRLGSSAATNYVALANLVLAELNALRTEIIAHTHATGVGPTGPAIGVGPASSSVAATKVKAE